MAEPVILLIDDDSDVRLAMRETLEDQGYRVAEAADGAEGLAYLRSHPAPALILLDWNMTPLNAPRFMEELSRDSSLPRVPVVLVTADIRADQKVKTASYHGCLTKPVNLDALFEVAARFAATA